jgi:hypothetical protein
VVWNYKLAEIVRGDIIFHVDETGTIGNVKYNANVTSLAETATLFAGSDLQFYGSSIIYWTSVDLDAISAAMAQCLNVDVSDISYAYSGVYYGDAEMGLNIKVETSSPTSAETIFASFSSSCDAATFNQNLAVTSVEYDATNLYGASISYFYFYLDKIEPTFTENHFHTLYVSNQSYVWSTVNGWNNDGSLTVASQSMLHNVANWDVQSSFTYGDHEYELSTTESNYGSNSPNVYVFGLGTYGGNWQAW